MWFGKPAPFSIIYHELVSLWIEERDDEYKYSCLLFFLFDLEFISFYTEMTHEECGSNAILI